MKRLIRVKSVLSVFHFLICGPAEGQGHNGNTENYICDNIVSIRLRRGQKFKRISLYFVKDFFSQSLQSITSAPSRSPPKGRCRLLWFCQRQVDAGYSGSVKDRLILVALVVDKSLTIRRLQANNNIANGICPSPSGEVRWGLMTIGRVTCSFPWGRSGWVVLRGRLDGG